MAILFLSFLLLLLLHSPSLAAAAAAAGCTALHFSGNRLFSSCADLPHLSASLHFTHDPANSTLSLAFAAPSPGWVAWGLGSHMVGAQCLLAFPLPDGTITAATANIVSYGPVTPSPISPETWGLAAEALGGGGGTVAVFATVKLPAGTRQVSHVWQVGPTMPGGAIGRHEFGNDNLEATGVLDLATAGASKPAAGVGNPGLLSRNVHGLLNAASWGILLPTGAMVARFLKAFKPESAAWFYLHVSCQLVGYAVGVAGWGTGLKLGSLSEGTAYAAHRNIGCVLFGLATLQVFALFLRPGREHKYRRFWDAYHHGVGYAVVVLGVLNVFKGIRILNPDPVWADGYKYTVCSLAVAAVVLEIVSWVRKGKPEGSEKHSEASGDAGYAHRQP